MNEKKGTKNRMKQRRIKIIATESETNYSSQHYSGGFIIAGDGGGAPEAAASPPFGLGNFHHVAFSRIKRV